METDRPRRIIEHLFRLTASGYHAKREVCMKKNGALIVLVLGLIAVPRPVSPQAVGDRVRVTTSDIRVVGQVVAVRGDEFELLMPGGSLGPFTPPDVTLLERSLGAGSEWRRGLLYGSLGGALLGLAAGKVFIEVMCTVGSYATLGAIGDDCGDGTFGAVVLNGVGWGLAGGLAGVGIGLMRPGPERWQEIPFGLDAASGFGSLGGAAPFASAGIGEGGAASPVVPFIGVTLRF